MPAGGFPYGQGGYGEGTYGGGIGLPPLSYYLGLIPSQYQSNSPEAMAWLNAVLGLLNDISTCVASITPAFTLDYAVGVQLDALGTIIGASRTLPFTPSNGVSAILDDDTYRILLRATVARNQWNGSINGLQAIWQSLFPGGTILILDNLNMTATITITGVFSSVIIDMIAGFAVDGATTGVMNGSLIIPRPEGVEYNFVIGELPYFGMDSLYDAELGEQIIDGFDTGHWV